MKVRTSELNGAALDWVVAKCEGYAEGPSGSFWITEDDCVNFIPSTDWAQGGPIIEREEISLDVDSPEFQSKWIAYKLGTPHEDNPQGGNTALIAAMRCYVASKLGDEVEVPDELIQEK